MTNDTHASDAQTESPDQSERLRRLGGPPPVGRADEAAYDELLGRICAAVGPRDIIEEIHVRDIVDYVWEVLQLRRLEARVLGAAAREGLEGLLGRLPGGAATPDLADRWIAREPRAVEEVDALLASLGLTIDAVMAAALTIELDAVEHIERMIGMAEARRDDTLRDIDGAREEFARALRRAAREAQRRGAEVLAGSGRLASEVAA